MSRVAVLGLTWLLGAQATSQLAAHKCERTRPFQSSGLADRRTLHIPPSMWHSAYAGLGSAWIEKLCCVYTWVVLDTEATVPFLVAFDGSRRTYEDQTTVAEVAEGAYAAVCGMSMGSADCASAANRCTASVLNPTAAPPKFGGSGQWESGAVETAPDSCNSSIQSTLRFGCTTMMATAQDICCHNTRFAEPRWYFKDAGGPGGLFAHLDRNGVSTFYDSACGIPLYSAPVGRSFADWEAESLGHGWPSFRREETFMENMVFRASGEIESTCGTHLGHNIPDVTGDRYCIDLVCIAGSPLTIVETRASLNTTHASTLINTPVRVREKAPLTLSTSTVVVFALFMFVLAVVRRAAQDEHGFELREPLTV